MMDVIDRRLNVRNVCQLYSCMTDEQRNKMSNVDFWYDSNILFDDLVKWIIDEMEQVIQNA